MNDHEVTCEWIEQKQFNASVNNHELIIDDRFESMGTDKGPRPKPLMLAALGGCNGMNVVSVLKKMRVEIDALSIKVKGELTDTDPKMYQKVFLNFHFTGKNLDKKNCIKPFSFLKKNIVG